MTQNIVSCPSSMKHTSMMGFFSKKQYAAMEKSYESIFIGFCIREAEWNPQS